MIHLAPAYRSSQIFRSHASNSSAVIKSPGLATSSSARGRPGSRPGRAGRARYRDRSALASLDRLRRGKVTRASHFGVEGAERGR